jgi:hypothetical protein
MSSPNPQEPDDEQLKRNRLVGRLLIVGMGVLVAAYVVVTFWR